MTDSQSARDDRAFFGHPKGLGFLAFTEAWERFSYYGMQSLLVLYMAKYLFEPGHIERIAFFTNFRALYGNLAGAALASAIFGTYTSLVYITPILGGFIADAVTGKRRAVIAGALLMALGHFLMAFEASFLFALLCLVLGSGLFKGNLASQVGGLYGDKDLRRAGAFQIYYLAINLAVIFSPLIVGTLGEKVGWHFGFGAAGVGMLVSIVIYLSGRRFLPPDSALVPITGVAAPKTALSRDDWISLGILIGLIPVLAVLMLPNQEIFNAYLLWGDKDFALTFFGSQVPTTWLITFDAIVSTGFLFIVAVFYQWYGRRRREPDELTKIAIGSVFVVGGMLCLFMAAATKTPGAKIGLAWPIAFHVLNSIGFAHAMPVALALFARIAPKSLNATVVSMYSLSFALANLLVGIIGGWFVTMPTTTFWLMHAGFAGGAGLVFLALKFALRRRLEEPEPVPETAPA